MRRDVAMYINANDHVIYLHGNGAGSFILYVAGLVIAAIVTALVVARYRRESSGGAGSGRDQ